MLEWCEEQLSKGSYSVLEILENCTPVLEFWAPSNELASVIESIRNKTDINETALHKLSKVSCTFRSILKKHGLKLGYKTRKSRVKTDVEKVVHDMLSEQEIQNFNYIHKGVYIHAYTHVCIRRTSRIVD